MEISQIYEAVNTATQEAIGDSSLVSEDLGNIVDVGTAIFNANSIDKYVRKLVDHIGRVIFVNRELYRSCLYQEGGMRWDRRAYCR